MDDLEARGIRDLGRREAVRRRARDHAVAHRNRPGLRAAARQAPNRHDAARYRPLLRRQGVCASDPVPGPPRPEILRQKIAVALAEKNSGSACLRSRGSSSTRSPAARGLRQENPAARCRHVPARRPGPQRREAVLFEGAQGTLLDVDHGTYPFVTSSSTLAAGCGDRHRHRPARIDRVIGVAKAYVTRVGEGPFPTEFDGPDRRSPARNRQRVRRGHRPRRRCGWFDLVALRYAVR